MLCNSLSAREVADKCGVSSTYVYGVARALKIERGESPDNYFHVMAARKTSLLQEREKTRKKNEKSKIQFKVDLEYKNGTRSDKTRAVLDLIDNQNLSNDDIAKLTNTVRQTVRSIRANPGKYRASISPKEIIVTLQKCAWCGGMFDPRTGGKPKVTCSASCKQAHNYFKASERNKEKLAKLRELVPAKPSGKRRVMAELTCVVCNNKFYTRQGEKKKTCNFACQLKLNAALIRDKTGTPVVNCPVCRKEFGARVSGRGADNLDKYLQLRRATYCSRECSDSAVMSGLHLRLSFTSRPSRESPLNVSVKDQSCAKCGCGSSRKGVAAISARWDVYNLLHWTHGNKTFRTVGESAFDVCKQLWKQSILCLGCYNTYKPIVAKALEAEELRLETGRANRKILSIRSRKESSRVNCREHNQQDPQVACGGTEPCDGRQSCQGGWEEHHWPRQPDFTEHGCRGEGHDHDGLHGSSGREVRQPQG